MRFRTSDNPKSRRDSRILLKTLARWQPAARWGLTKQREKSRVWQEPQGRALLKEAIKEAHHQGSPKSRTESEFGGGFSDVKAHVGSEGGSPLGAAAFATGTNVSFTRSNGEVKALAHELAHVVQQKG